MDMDAAGVIDLCPTGTPLPDVLLHRLDILILTDRGHHLHRVGSGSGPVPPGLTADTGVSDHFPPPSLGIRRRIGVVVPAHMGGLGAEVIRHDFGGGSAGKAGHFNLNAKILISQPESPSNALI